MAVDIAGLADRKLIVGGLPMTLALLLFLGLSIAAVEAMRVDCRDVYLTDDAGHLLLSDAGQMLMADGQQCTLLWGSVRAPMPDWPQAILAALLAR